MEPARNPGNVSVHIKEDGEEPTAAFLTAQGATQSMDSALRGPACAVRDGREKLVMSVSLTQDVSMGLAPNPGNVSA